MKMKKLLSALLASGVAAAALCAPVNAEVTDRDRMLDESELKFMGAIPVCALGEDVSLYEKGDVNMDGTIDAKDAILTMHEFNAYTLIELGHFLDERQRQLADVFPRFVGKCTDPIDTGDSCLILHYVNYKQIGGDMQMDAFIKLYTENYAELAAMLKG